MSQNNTNIPFMYKISQYSFLPSYSFTFVCIVGVSGIGAGALAGLDVPGAMMMLGQSPVGPVLKFGVAFPLVYHYLGGVRHIMWDKAPEKLTNENVETSSQVLIGSAVALSAGIAML